MKYYLIINENGYCGGYSNSADKNTIEADIKDENHFLSHIGAYKIDGKFDEKKWQSLTKEWEGNNQESETIK